MRHASKNLIGNRCTDHNDSQGNSRNRPLFSRLYMGLILDLPNTAAIHVEEALSLRPSDQMTGAALDLTMASNHVDIIQDTDTARKIEAAQESFNSTSQKDPRMIASTDADSEFLKEDSTGISDTVAQPFRLRRLPLEVRNLIYKELLIMPPAVIVDFKYCFRNDIAEPSTPTQATVCQVFRVSKQIYEETVPIFFGYNTFKVANLYLLADFLTCVGPDSRRGIHTIEVDYCSQAPARAMKLLAGCIGLRRLSLHITWGTFRHIRSKGGDKWQLMKLDGLKDLLRIRGLQHVSVDVSDKCLTYEDGYYRISDMDQFQKALEVLKLPHTKTQLTIQRQKDYPQKATTRTLFGKANVITRTEKQMMAKKSSML